MRSILFILFVLLQSGMSYANPLQSITSLHPKGSDEWAFYSNLGVVLEVAIENSDKNKSKETIKEVGYSVTVQDRELFEKIIKKTLRSVPGVKYIVSALVNPLFLGLAVVLADSGLTPDPLAVVNNPARYSDKQRRAAAILLLKHTDTKHFRYLVVSNDISIRILKFISLGSVQP